MKYPSARLTNRAISGWDLSNSAIIFHFHESKIDFADFLKDFMQINLKQIVRFKAHACADEAHEGRKSGERTCSVRQIMRNRSASMRKCIALAHRLLQA
jgi:hypothetical protein